MLTANPKPEKLPRDKIDEMLIALVWTMQSYNQKNTVAAMGLAMHDYPTDTDPADYILCVNEEQVGFIEAILLAKHKEKGLQYATTILKYLSYDVLNWPLNGLRNIVINCLP